ncbi:hypothetical protein SAMN05216403_13522 [Nitrosospira multiformis ATCC 25196]|jgi:hypothetical protein|uniref:Uncharacterized protein n=1 Tax=Nitrosospira multiformis (strain ATCC 25196 / NCIMB 11849 / C 71) TaxID=323848 RepID=A0A1H5XRF2_NITMU|nr:hypothetical protein SAMN05216403_13522 [Nitrosospira multiformis ATCC 25196]
MPMVCDQEKFLSPGYPERHLYTDDTSYPSHLREATNKQPTLV